jgi:F0F1-type ATP synthase assembly protein I
MVRCANCGFLARREKTIFTDLHDVGLEERRGWVALWGYPVCFVMKLSFKEECDRKFATSPNSIHGSAEHSQEVIDTERECSGFTPWIQGSTPKEHRQMLIDEQIRKEQAAQRERDRQWQQEQREREDNRAEERRKSDRHWQLKTQFVAIFLAAFVGILFGIIKDYFTPKTPPIPIQLLIDKEGKPFANTHDGVPSLDKSKQ